MPHPAFDPSQPLPLDKDKRLKEIIDNVNEHHAQVRHNILHRPLPSPSVAAAKGSSSNGTHKRTASQVEATHKDMKELLSVPYDSSQPKPLAPKQTSLPQRIYTSYQISPPAVTTDLKTRIQAIEAYARHAEETVAYYKRSAERRASGNTATNTEPPSASSMRRPSMGGYRTVPDPADATVSAMPENRRQPITSPATPVTPMTPGAFFAAAQAAVQPPPKRGATYDRDRDPRLSRR